VRRHSGRLTEFFPLQSLFTTVSPVEPTISRNTLGPEAATSMFARAPAPQIGSVPVDVGVARQGLRGPDPFAVVRAGQGESVGYALARWIVGSVFRVLWRPHIVGGERIPLTGPVIIASNHLSFIDSVVIPLAVPRRVCFLAKAEYFEGRGLRGRMTAWFFRAVSAVPVRRDSSSDSMASLELAMDVLRAGLAFGIYPEGTRSRDGRLYRGRTGVGWLAMQSGAPVVPVALVGTNDVQPVGSRLPRRRPVTVAFGTPVDPAPWIASVSASGGAGRARREITDAVMASIAAMSPQELADGYNERPPEDDDPTAI
jgi:1-acyl-sn-glycerol-3-phosphate acyltransferase